MLVVFLLTPSIDHHTIECKTVLYQRSKSFFCSFSAGLLYSPPPHIVASNLTELLYSCWWVVCCHFCHRRWFKQINIFSLSFTQEVNRGWWTKGSSETTGVSAGAGVEERKGKIKVLEMEIGPVQGDYRVQQKFMHCRLEVGSLDAVRMKRKTQRGQRLETMTQG